MRQPPIEKIFTKDSVMGFVLQSIRISRYLHMQDHLATNILQGTKLEWKKDTTNEMRILLMNAILKQIGHPLKQHLYSINHLKNGPRDESVHRPCVLSKRLFKRDPKENF